MKNTFIEDCIEWDVYNWSKALDFWIGSIQELKNPKILLLGERNGGLTLWLAKQGYNVISSDYNGITEHGIEMHKRYGVSGLIEYRKIDIYNIPFSDNSFDLIICKSVLGGLKMDRKDPKTRSIDGQSIAVKHIYDKLKPNGWFLGAENMKGSLMHQVARRMLKKDKGWLYLTKEDLNVFFINYSKLELKFYGYFGAFFKSKETNKVASKFDRLLNQFLLNSSKYISFIKAQK
jgi:SAM-dependent methyltransferase